MPCTSCGACCDPVTIPNWAAEGIMRKHLTPPPHPEAADQLVDMWEPLGPVPGLPHMTAMKCIHYDVESRLCLAYDKRPPVCLDYPWGRGRGPNLQDMNGPRDMICGFQEEVGRRVLPLIEVRHS